MPGIHRRALATAQPAVGRDAEAWCAKCGFALEHMIVAMVGTQIVQVRCRTCGGTHKYKTNREVAEAGASPAAARKAARAEAGAAKSPGAAKTPGAPKAPRAPKPAVESAEARSARLLWQRKMALLDRARATPYAISIVPMLGELLDHATFGFGIVEHAVDGKIQVLFEQGYKVLIFGR